MTITQLEYVLAVDQFKHFGKAAEHCHVSQPTLSMQIQKLEQDLNIIIFDRSKNPILTTAIGQKIIVQAKNVIREHKKIFDIIKQQENEISGDLQVGIIPTLSPYLLPFFLEKFAQKFPKVRLSVKEMQTAHIITALENDDIDCGLLVTPLHNDKIVERKLFTEKFMIFTSKTHPFDKKSVIKMEDLKGENPWLLEEGHCFRDQALSICKIKDGNKEQMFKAGSLETLMNIVKSSQSFTLVPEMASFYNPEIRDQIKPISQPTPVREVSLVHSRLFLKEKILDALEKTIIENLPKTIQSNKREEKIIPI